MLLNCKVEFPGGAPLNAIEKPVVVEVTNTPPVAAARPAAELADVRLTIGGAVKDLLNVSIR